MARPKKTNPNRAIDAGIAILDNLTYRPAQILEQVFEDDFLRRILSSHHVGLLAPPCSDKELLKAIEERGIDVLSVFPSAVVASQLTGRFGKQVSADIYLCRSMAKNAPRLEIFRVVDGLDAADVRTAMHDILHIAYTPHEPVNTREIFKKIVADGLEYVGGGVNQSMSEEDAVTVLYFCKRQPIAEVSKIELFLSGRHSLASITETTQSTSVSLNTSCQK
uniref:Uncharacterized protein n=1 Tax=Candidatus Kentrum sp. FM TaxID=2126340 RepID=A0A450VQL1_9GAMM|nr:MAG: hypothetical protein BECKFM1743A_GA0114220_100305 [Candidatus Kentron sp. FM]VFJ46018.1 MAG: hypothetical protein BECKFM1743C_GA0114222_100335 [Candidatus Kentron sp. FM]VFK07045.1 MAG: hypothetical protein BECKFM1743B_GA0114221_100305 [Candidatus Kentron sp. FM]